LLLVNLPQHEKNIKAISKIKIKVRAHQHDSPGARVSPFNPLSACVLPSILGYGTEKQEPEPPGLQDPVGSDPPLLLEARVDWSSRRNRPG
jgi:hypothetical protein